MLVAYVLRSAVILCSASAAPSLMLWQFGCIVTCEEKWYKKQTRISYVTLDVLTVVSRPRSPRMTPYSLQIRINIWQRNTSVSRSKTLIPLCQTIRCHVYKYISYFRHSDLRYYRVNPRKGTSLFQKKKKTLHFAMQCNCYVLYDPHNKHMWFLWTGLTASKTESVPRYNIFYTIW
jgi:hypothetical protein